MDKTKIARCIGRLAEEAPTYPLLSKADFDSLFPADLTERKCLASLSDCRTRLGVSVPTGRGGFPTCSAHPTEEVLK